MPTTSTGAEVMASTNASNDPCSLAPPTSTIQTLSAPPGASRSNGPVMPSVASTAGS
jgi:hypothetical protein